MARPESEHKKLARSLVYGGCVDRQEVHEKTGVSLSTVDKLIREFRDDAVQSSHEVVGMARTVSQVRSSNAAEFFMSQAIAIAKEDPHLANVHMQTAMTAVSVVKTLSNIDAQQTALNMMRGLDAESEKAVDMVKALAMVVKAGE